MFCFLSQDFFQCNYKNILQNIERVHIFLFFSPLLGEEVQLGPRMLDKANEDEPAVLDGHGDDLIAVPLDPVEEAADCSHEETAALKR